LTFTSFRTESESDILRIYDLGSETLIATYSGIYNGTDVPPPVLVPSGKVFLIFSTNGSVNEAGWDVDYVSYAVGQEERILESTTNFYPNPATDIVTLELTSPNSQTLNLELIDVNGKVRLSAQMTKSSGAVQKQVDVRSLPAGVYFLRIIGDDETVIKKLIIN